MRVLVIGGGGREHAIIWKLRKDDPALEIFCAPGNAGIGKIARNVPIEAADVKNLARFAAENGVDLTVVGPEAALAAGVADEFAAKGLEIFGPTKAAARLESSKDFAKRFMRKYCVPTAGFETFDRARDALSYIREQKFPLVVKADGLAAGKGVAVCQSEAEAAGVLREVMEGRKFGDSGEKVVIEEFLEGKEATYMVFSDGETFLPMAGAHDYKRVFDGDQGGNTGGMGSVSPSPRFTAEIEKTCLERIVRPTFDGLRRENIRYAGVLYFELMLTPDGPKVIEYNCRFGDPETEAVIPRLKTGLLPVFTACARKRLGGIGLEWSDEASVCVMLASGGYPGEYKKGLEISGLGADFGEKTQVFHAGTAEKDGKTVTDGGRVLCVTALGKDAREARERAYEAARRIGFDGAHYRRDIGSEE